MAHWRDINFLPLQRVWGLMETNISLLWVSASGLRACRRFISSFYHLQCFRWVCECMRRMGLIFPFCTFCGKRNPLSTYFSVVLMQFFTATTAAEGEHAPWAFPEEWTQCGDEACVVFPARNSLKSPHSFPEAGRLCHIFPVAALLPSPPPAAVRREKVQAIRYLL